MLEEILSRFSAIHWLVIGINIVLMLVARPLLKQVLAYSEKSDDFKRRLIIFRGLNFLILFLYIGYVVGLNQLTENHQSWLLSGIKIIAIVYITYFLMHLARYLILRQYGIPKKVDGKSAYIESYEARLMTLLSTIFIVVCALTIIVRTLGFDSLLQTTGALGFVGVILGLTQASWAPDIISGLILLNSNIWEEGDVVLFSDGEEHLGIIFKTRFFHTELLNLSNNCRMMIKNSRIRDFTITNLSKFASAKGYRDCLEFKIGYGDKPSSVNNMFNEAFVEAETLGLPIEYKHGLEVAVQDAGDHAIKWKVFYHMKEVEKILKLRRQMMQIIWETAEKHNINLSTPIIHSRI